MKIIGFKRSNFTTKDGTSVTGYNIYFTYPLSAGEDTSGKACERYYLTDEKLVKCGYTLRVGDEVKLSFNRFGKPDSIAPVR